MLPLLRNNLLFCALLLGIFRDKLNMEPPPEPPPRPPLNSTPQLSLKISSYISPFIRKLQAALDGYWFEPEIRPKPIDPLSPPCGPYFFYGTLTDPSLLREILSLAEKPEMRPAKVVGYALRLWGQYPALVDGGPGHVIEGMVYNVEEKKHAHRLAEYETNAYWPTPCQISFTDGGEPQEVSGSAFEYVGNSMDISDGAFDLRLWLRRMGRTEGDKRNI